MNEEYAPRRKYPDIWASRPEWRRRGYTLRRDVPLTPIKASSGWVEYPAYHAFHVRLRPGVWSHIVGLLPPGWHHLQVQEPDRATVCAVHDLLLDHGQDKAAGLLRWAVEGTEERFRADLAAHQAVARKMVRREPPPPPPPKTARDLAQEAAKWAARGFVQPLCLIPVGLDWQDRPALLDYLRESGRAKVADRLSGVGPEDLQVRRTRRKNQQTQYRYEYRQILYRVVRTYRGLSAEEWERIVANEQPVPDHVVELLLGPEASPACAP